MFRCIASQSSSVWSRVRPRYLNCATPSIRSYPYLPYNLNSISPNLCASLTSLRHRRIFVALSHLSVFLCHPNLATGMCIPHWSHHGSGVGLSCRIVIFDFQYMYMKCSLSLPRLCAPTRHPSTVHATDFNTLGKDTTYISSPPLLTSTPRICVVTVP